jgi:hypothetical protein
LYRDCFRAIGIAGCPVAHHLLGDDDAPATLQSA